MKTLKKFFSIVAFIVPILVTMSVLPDYLNGRELALSAVIMTSLSFGIYDAFLKQK